MTRTLFAGGALLVLSSLWLLPVCDPSEARYAEIAREMADGGSWLVPHLLGRPHLTKPPLSYWLAAASISVFGPTAWAARLPSVLAFLASLAITAHLGARLWKRPRAGEWSGWALVFSGLPLVSSNLLTADAITAACATAAVACGWLSISAAEEGRGRRWALGFYAAAALAFLAKGPPALLAPAALVLLAIRRRRRFASARLASPAGLLLFAGLALPWYAAVALKVPGTLQYWWEEEVVRRAAGDSYRNMPFYLYPVFLIGGALPAAVLLPPALARWRRDLRDEEASAPAELIAWWIGLPLVVLCAARSRLPLYLTPLFVPLALVIGRWLDLRLGTRRFPAPAAFAAVAAAAGIGFAVKLSLSRLGDVLPPDPRPIARAIEVDAARLGARPQVFFTSRPASFPCYGLAFYLRSIVEETELRELVEPRPEGDPPTVRQLLNRPPPPGARQYFAVREDKASILEERCPACPSRWILRTGRIWVWARD